MGRVLIVFDTKHGQTQKIVNYIAQEIQKHGHVVDSFLCQNIPRSILIADYDAIIVGAPVYRSRFSKKLINWIRAHASELTYRPSSFFDVSLGVLEQKPAVQADELRIVNEFFTLSQWHPSVWSMFAGALSFSRYNFLTKLIMRFIAKRVGLVLERGKDYEYTNWEDVAHFTVKAVSSLSLNATKDGELS